MEEAVRLLRARETGAAGAEATLRRRLTVTRSLVDRLGLEAELHGHEGCVNCLEWSSDGMMLASASDDQRVMLWSPFRHSLLRTLHTGHHGNIFSVKFVGASALATGAGDNAVRVRDVAGGEAQLVCKCHRLRVKRLAVSPADPHVFWSGGEDGLVLQHDTRAPHVCQAGESTVLVNLARLAGRRAEVKCVSSNPRRAHQLVVGANDCFVRLYDTRMIRLSSLAARDDSSVWRINSERLARGGGDYDNIPREAAGYYAPGHLSSDPDSESSSKIAATYVCFSWDGTELLVNLGSEQVYLFDLAAAPRPQLLESYIIEHNHGNHGDQVSDSGAGCGQQALPPDVAAIKEAANSRMHRGQFADAVTLYNEALALSPACALLLANRAAALLRRDWAGDLYAAVRDCYAAIAADPAHLKAHFRLAKALLELGRAREADECLRYLQSKFPAHAASHAVRQLAEHASRALGAESARPHAPDPPAPGDLAPAPLERALRAAARDYSARFLGHCNTTTDIKEAALLGHDAAFVAAGSDDGGLFVWSRRSGNLVRVLRADDSILNCVQPHPTTCLLATSGIESVIRLWSPRPEDGRSESRLVREPSEAAAANQLRMRTDPYESMLLHLGGSVPVAVDHPGAQCRPS